VPLAGAELWTESSGSGPPLVLAHGGPGMSDNLRALAAMLDDLATVYRYDQRACGSSTGSGRMQTVDSSVADLDALREHWGCDRWIVGGHSWGAALALFYALSHPERTEGVVYISGPGVTKIAHPAARSRLERLTAAERQAFTEAKSRAAAGDASAATDVAHLLWRTDFADPANVPDFNVEPLFRYPHNAEAAAALTASADTYLVDGRLAEAVRTVVVPVLILHGRDDPLPVEGAIDLAQRLPAAELVVLDGVGHTVWLEDASTVRDVLRQFIAARR
jgi:proline iminopeptidase